MKEKALDFESLKTQCKRNSIFSPFSAVIISRDPEPTLQLTHSRAHNVAFLGPSKL